MEEVKIPAQEKESAKYSEEEITMLLRGERPEGMGFEKFKAIRAYLKKMTKLRLKGDFIHVSSWIEEIKGSKFSIRRTKTYTKDGKI